MKLPLITLAAFVAASAPSRMPATTAAPVVPAVTAVSVVPASGRADVVVALQAPVEVQDFTLDAPYRVVLPRRAGAACRVRERG